jgi:NAD(P)-dependent dehydrogenase (short-subunit alcohol dehydrogenase family)
MSTQPSTTSSPRFAGQTFLITGAGAGFGRATARGAARDGAACICLAEFRPDRLAAIVEEVEALGARAVPIAGELRGADTCTAAVAAALEATGRLDVLVSNHAMMTYPVPFLEDTFETWDAEIEIGFTSHARLAQAAGRAMAAAGRGSILFTASVNALGAGKECAAYCAVKAGLVSLTQVLAAELAPAGVRVNCVSPGPADTQRSVDLVGDEKMDRFRRSFPGVPLNRLAAAEDVAEAFLYLASDAAAYVTGHNLVVDGGLTAQLYDVPE